MKRVRPFKPGNQFGRGRPPGSRNKNTLLAQQLLNEHGESIVRKALVKALEGDARMLQTLLGYVLPRRKHVPLNTAALRTATAEELAQSFDLIVKRACSGQLTLDQAHELVALIEARRQFLQSEIFETRLRAVEKLR